MVHRLCRVLPTTQDTDFEIRFLNSKLNTIPFNLSNSISQYNAAASQSKHTHTHTTHAHTHTERITYLYYHAHNYNKQQHFYPLIFLLHFTKEWLYHHHHSRWMWRCINGYLLSPIPTIIIITTTTTTRITRKTMMRIMMITMIIMVIMIAQTRMVWWLWGCVCSDCSREEGVDTMYWVKKLNKLWILDFPINNRVAFSSDSGCLTSPSLQYDAYSNFSPSNWIVT